MARGTAGFTLVEALCALAILAVTLVALYGLGGTVARLAGASSDANRVSLIAHSKLDELAAIETPLPRTDSGMIGGVQWRLDAAEIGAKPEQHALHLQRVTLSLTWREGGGDHVLRVLTRHLGVDRT